MLAELYKQSSTIPHETITHWKEQGKKVIGFMCSYVPEEVIYAAGMLPFRIRGTGCTRTNNSDVVMSNYSCSFARSCLEFALDGTFDFLDGLVAVDSCSQMHRLFDNWRYQAKLPFMHLLRLPYKNSPAAVEWYRGEIATLIQGMEKVFQVEVTDANLVKAIEVYNETRALLQSLYELRKSEHPSLTGSQNLSILLAATSTPKDRYNELLQTSLKEIRSAPPVKDFRARLMLVGSSLDDPAVVKIIEDQGGLVVADALCFGSRYFLEPVDGKDAPVPALARSYLSRPKCPRMMTEHAALFAFIEDMARKFKVDGIIFEKMQYCDLWGGESLFLDRKFKEAGIPFLSIQREQVLTNAAQIATRVEAFIEMITGVI